MIAKKRVWTPPKGLKVSRPRDVRLSSQGKALLCVAVALAAGGVSALTGLSAVQQRQVKELRALVEQGRDVEGEAIRVWRKSGESKTPMVEVRFMVDGRAYEMQSKVALNVWRKLSKGSPMRVRYLPSNPSLNQLSRNAKKPMPFWVPYLLGCALIGGGAVLLIPIQRQKRLLADGRVTEAIVTKHTKSYGESGSHGQIVHYAFSTMSGGKRTGHGGPSKSPPPVGSSICVIYDPDNRKRSSMYPMCLVRPGW